LKQQLAQLLRALQDAASPLPVERLALLSDLPADGLQELKEAWPSLDPARRLAILAELRRLGDARIELTFESVNRLALGDPAPEVRRQAIGNLWESEDPALVAPLSQSLDSDPDAGVRAAAASALGQFIYLGELERVPESLRRRAEEVLLRAVGSDEVPAVRLAGLESLGYSSRPEVPALIEAGYRSAEELSVRSALIAMSRSANIVWAPAVQAELASPSPALRLEAARAAGEIEMREAVPTLVELLEDVSDDVRRAAIWSLGQLGGQQAERALEGLLRRKPPQAEVALIEEALENLAFVDGTRDFLMLDFDDGVDNAH